LYIMLFL